MSSYYDDASLMLLASGGAQKDGKVYSVKPTDGSGDFTFTRGSNLSATRVDASQLIEKGRENLFTYSNDLSNAIWQLGLITATSGQAGYDGSSDAWLITKDAAAYRAIEHDINNSGVYTYSVYAKANTLNLISLRDQTLGQGAGFNLTNGTTYGNSGVSSSIDSVGGGWYRCSVTFNGSSIRLAIYIDFVNATAGSVFVQDFQVEKSLIATPYIESGATTGKAGILENTPRFDYSGGATCPSLLLEPSRTNLLTQSEYFGSSDWTLNNVSITSNATTSPEGVINASKWIANSGLSSKNIYQVPSTANGVAHTASAYFKAEEYPLAFIRLGGVGGSPYVIYDLRDESVVSTAGLTSHDIQSVGNGWYRIEATATTTTTLIAPNIAFIPSSGYTLNANNIPEYTGDGTSGGYIYGAQCEPSASYATSYIPTYGVSQTRAADACIKTGISSLINSPEGTMFIDIAALYDDGTNRYLSINDGTTSNYIYFRYVSTSNNMIMRVAIGGVTINTLTYVSPDTTIFSKAALKWKGGDYSFWVDGVERGSNSSATAFGAGVLNEITFGFPTGGGGDLNSKMKQLLVFPTALSDLDLAILTGATTYNTFAAMALALNYTVYE